VTKQKLTRIRAWLHTTMKRTKTATAHNMSPSNAEILWKRMISQLALVLPRSIPKCMHVSRARCAATVAVFVYHRTSVIFTSQEMSVYATTRINTTVTQRYPSTAKIRAKMGGTPRLRSGSNSATFTRRKRKQSRASFKCRKWR